MIKASASTEALVLFAHGSRDPLWRKPLEAVAARVSAMAPVGTRVLCAYLELNEPDLQTAVASLAAGGARHIRVVPIFFGVGRHVREDLPILLHELQTSYPQVAFELKQAIGEDPRVIDLVAEIALMP